MNKNNLVFVLITIIVLLGLFYILNPKQVSAPVKQTPSIKTFDLVIKDGKLISGTDTLKVTEKDQVTINITCDCDEELHLHGYNKSVDLEASKSAQLTFSANLTGRFPFELEKSKTELGALEVLPK